MTISRSRLTILGATGSIGASTLDVVAQHPDLYEVYAVSGATRLDRLVEICQQHQPRYAVVLDGQAAGDLQQRLRQADVKTEVLYGATALEQVATSPDVDAVMAAIVGAAGMPATLAAARAGKKVLLANKETLVLAGPIFMQAVAQSGAILLPIDSEHNAIFQCLPAARPNGLTAAGIKRLLLTASGGPFRTMAATDLPHVTVEQAVRHPKWSMGRKISVDSATLMNKGLEVIEAHWLFNAPADQIDVVVHPQSVVHSLVEYVDGSVLAQLGSPDMRTPIACALAWPGRFAAGVTPLDLFTVGHLEFEAPDRQRFPCLDLAYAALRAGGTATAILNAANEVAVAAFLAGRIGFMAIPALIASVLDTLPVTTADSLELLLDADQRARDAAQAWLKAH